MDLDVLLVNYFLNTSVLWRLRWRYGLVVRARGVLSGWDGVNLVRDVLSGWVEMNLDDDVEERNDRIQRNNHRRVDDRHHSRKIFVWLDHSDDYIARGRKGNETPKHRDDKKMNPHR